MTIRGRKRRLTLSLAGLAMLALPRMASPGRADPSAVDRDSVKRAPAGRHSTTGAALDYRGAFAAFAQADAPVQRARRDTSSRARRWALGKLVEAEDLLARIADRAPNGDDPAAARDQEKCASAPRRVLPYVGLGSFGATGAF